MRRSGLGLGLAMVRRPRGLRRGRPHPAQPLEDELPQPIRAFLLRLHVRTREGYAPSVRTLRRWRRTRAFPAHPLPGKRGVVWSTSFLIVTWVITGGIPDDARDAVGRFRSRRVRIPAASASTPR